MNDLIEKYGDTVLDSDVSYKKWMFFSYQDSNVDIYIEFEIDEDDPKEKYTYLYDINKTVREIYDNFNWCDRFSIDIDEKKNNGE